MAQIGRTVDSRGVANPHAPSRRTGALAAPLLHRLRPRRFKLVIDWRLYTFYEFHGVGKARVQIECWFVDPRRMHEEESGIARRSKRADRDAAGFRADRSEHVAQQGGDTLLLVLAGVKTGEDEKLHRSSDLARILNGSPTLNVQSRRVSGKIANGPPHGYMSGIVPHFADHKTGELHAPGEVGMFFKLCSIDRPEWLGGPSRRAEPVRES